MTTISLDLPPHAVVTDVASTKRSIVAAGEASLGGQFVGGHPIAGGEKAGIAHAQANLFKDRLCILTPTVRSDPAAVEKVADFWNSLSMRVVRLVPDAHDRLMADVSHLPHALAAALISMQTADGLGVAGRGFADLTRIAAGDSTLWTDILLDNRDNILTGLGQLTAQCEQLRSLLEDGSRPKLAKWLENAAARRRALDAPD